MTTEERTSELYQQYRNDGMHLVMPFDEWLVEHFELIIDELEQRIETLEATTS
jgi:hypothetical protein